MKFCKILASKEKWRIYNGESSIVITFMQRELGLIIKKFEDGLSVERISVEILLIWKRVVIVF